MKRLPEGNRQKYKAIKLLFTYRIVAESVITKKRSPAFVKTISAPSKILPTPLLSILEILGESVDRLYLM
jgi:hypothetical protein